LYHLENSCRLLEVHVALVENRCFNPFEIVKISKIIFFEIFVFHVVGYLDAILTTTAAIVAKWFFEALKILRKNCSFFCEDH
jgi:hypothetical protein